MRGMRRARNSDLHDVNGNFERKKDDENMKEWRIPLLVLFVVWRTIGEKEG